MVPLERRPETEPGPATKGGRAFYTRLASCRLTTGRRRSSLQGALEPQWVAAADDELLGRGPDLVVEQGLAAGRQPLDRGGRGGPVAGPDEDAGALLVERDQGDLVLVADLADERPRAGPGLLQPGSNHGAGHVDDQ